MDLWSSLHGMVEIMITSADVSGAINSMQNLGMVVSNGEYVDPLRFRFFIRSQDLAQLKLLMKKRGDSIVLLQKKGLFYILRNLLKRPVIVFGLLLILLFSIWLPSRVVFIRIEGNSTIPARQIIERAESCGIKFGASRRMVRSEKIKNELLEVLPQLQWAGINTYGCTAVITVQERNDSKTEVENSGISNMIALRDGIVRSITVLQGTARCYIGQAVTKGQILVSGYTDCGICLKGVWAKGEIYGDTLRELSAVCPTEYAQRDTVTASDKKYSLILGKKRINLFKGSGISGGTCAKIYEEKYLTLPGGFVLPIALAWEVSYEYETQPMEARDSQSLLTQYVSWYLPEQMTAGCIYKSDQVYSQAENLCRLDGIYHCYEMIGITHEEERITGYE